MRADRKGERAPGRSPFRRPTVYTRLACVYTGMRALPFVCLCVAGSRPEDTGRKRGASRHLARPFDGRLSSRGAARSKGPVRPAVEGFCARCYRFARLATRVYPSAFSVLPPLPDCEGDKRNDSPRRLATTASPIHGYRAPFDLFRFFDSTAFVFLCRVSLFSLSLCQVFSSVHDSM